ncbi:hypothetical protein [Ectobacillus panaciterrae]|uniref:hypothetical protein n=1 Tax=Ectobacillus panaciterrae TaxID=363872 RepID=UPI00040582D6|nr:hypothetical protein [Ectobacillus panaciterrae]
MLKKLAFLLICGSLLAACGTNENISKKTLSEMEPGEKKPAAGGADKNAADNEQAAATQQAPAIAPAPQEAAGEATSINWDDFFDNGDQTKPSKKFAGMNGKKVVMEGYMGELISMKGGWFLLIPQPGAECPFCSNDQSYWNRIMIVFVKEPNHLRLIPGKVRVTATLDVGAKQDQSGYTTMFRLYHATFESAK